MCITHLIIWACTHELVYEFVSCEMDCPSCIAMRAENAREEAAMFRRRLITTSRVRGLSLITMGLEAARARVEEAASRRG